MIMQAHQITVDSSEFQDLLDCFTESKSLQDLCTQIMHSSFSNGRVRGSHIFLLNHKTNLGLVASYGEKYQDGAAEVSIWDDSVPAKCIREKSQQFQTSVSSYAILAFPFLKGSIPIGCMVLLLAQEVTENPVSSGLESVLSKLGMFLVNAYANPRKQPSRPVATNLGDAMAKPEDLTTRQLTILAHMNAGMTNSEISKAILLSESTVRQETIRIYKSLAVSRRAEAVLRARSLGLITRSPVK